ncbi:hypothetical protein D3C71_1576900 [compost metagenome]
MAGDGLAGVVADVGHQAQAVGVVGFDAAMGQHQGVGRARQLHALAAAVGQLRGLQLEGHGDIAATPAGRGKGRHCGGKAVEGHQFTRVVQALGGEFGKARMDPGRAAVLDGIAHDAVKIDGGWHGVRGDTGKTWARDPAQRTLVSSVCSRVNLKRETTAI